MPNERRSTGWVSATGAGHPTLSIARLSLRLPAGFAVRASRIARLTAHALAAQPIGASARLDNLHLPPVRVNARRTDRAIAQELASAIARGITQATTSTHGVNEGRHRC